MRTTHPDSTANSTAGTRSTATRTPAKKKAYTKPAYRASPGPTALLTYEQAVNDNIPAKQLREVAESQRADDRGREQRTHLATLAGKLEQGRGW